ncbi:MAG: M4 family metallopeptidase [Myxococcaceae bacterium]|nr:M4 family metallopeptidase [Myxococcaceae bacterium]MCI0672500.1 M4 family metallopeptidase [Myxococcaceae bacterium]
MRPTHRPAATALALLMFGGAVTAEAAHPVLPRTELVLHQKQEPQRAVKAQAFVRAQVQGLGLGSSDALQMGRHFTNAQGQTIVRFSQTHEGKRVFGADAVVAVHPDQRTELLVRALESDIRISSSPVLSAHQARLVSHRELMPQGAYQEEPHVELVVFPTRFTGGMKPRYDAKTGVSWDREESVLAPRPTGTHVWAYEVTSILRSREDGARDMHVIVDARTGDVLRKWDASPAFLPKGQTRVPRTYGAMELARSPLKIAPALTVAPAALARMKQTSSTSAAASAQEVLGNGLGYYNGQVKLATSENTAVGGYDLWDYSRAPNPHPTYGTFGNVTMYHDVNNYQYSAYVMDNQAGSQDNWWGDGFVYMAPAPIVYPEYGEYEIPWDGFHYGDANGQTAAVDAHFASTTTYDMYKHVLGRAGLDGQDSGIISVVHYRYWYRNAQWSSWDQMMIYGDGNFPFFPDGDRSFTSLDIGAHEMSHGVMSATANLDYMGEPGGLNEANSDMMAMAAVAYSKRLEGDPVDRIPAVPLPWTLAPELNPGMGPIRYLYKPSLDGISPDTWFYGMSMLDVHYTSGPANRMFHSLADGTSSDASSDHHSPYLPEGMAGIGLDAATRIWFKAVTEHFTSTTNYAGAREACILAATDLYGASSPELAAVENAFGAINVGPAHGKALRPLVTFPGDLVSPDSSLVTDREWTLGDVFLRTPVVPAGEVARLHARVDHATDTSVTWKAGIAKGFYSPAFDPLDVTAACGIFDAEGRYHAPRNAPAWCGVRAFSKQDPLEFGASMVFVARLDADGDGEQDAVDQGMLALTWGLSGAATEKISAYPDPEGRGLVDDFSVQLWGEGFNNAFTK